MFSTRFFTSLVLVVFVSSAMFAQSNPPPKETAKLYKLEGHWVGDTHIQAGPEKEVVPYHFEFTRVLDGWGLSYREYVNSKVFGNYRGVGNLGFDPNDGLYHWHTLSNAGDSHDHIGTWLDDNTFVMERTATTNKQIYNEKIKGTFQSPTELALEFDLYINQENVIHVNGILKKTVDSFPMMSAK